MQASATGARRRSSGRAGLSGKDLSDILRQFGKEDHGVFLARGKEDVISAIKKDGANNDVSSAQVADLIKKVESVTGDNDGIELYKTSDGALKIVISKVDADIGDILKSLGGDSGNFDIGGILKGLRASDEDAGGDATSGLDEFREYVEKQLRDALEKHRPTPFGVFQDACKAHAKANAPKPEKEGASVITKLMAVAGFASMELMRYVSTQKGDVSSVIRAAGVFIEQSAQASPVQFGNLNRYLATYGIDLSALSFELQNFSEKSRMDSAEGLVNDLARLLPACLNVMKDAADKAKQDAKSAVDI